MSFSKKHHIILFSGNIELKSGLDMWMQCADLVMI